MGRLSIKSKSFKEYYQNEIDKKKLAAQKLKEEQKKEFKRQQIEEIVRRYKSDWRSELDEAMTTSALMSTVLPAEGEVDLSTAVPTFTFSGPGHGGGFNSDHKSFISQHSQYDTVVVRVTSSSSDWSLHPDGPSLTDDEAFSTIGSGGVGSKIVVIPLDRRYTGFFYTARDDGSITFRTTFQRRSPLNVFVALDDPEASAFIRDGSTDNLSRAEKKKKLEDHLKSGQEYLDKMFGEGMPKGATEISDYEPQQSFSHIAQALPYTDEDDAFDNDYYKGPPPDIDDDSDFDPDSFEYASADFPKGDPSKAPLPIRNPMSPGMPGRPGSGGRPFTGGPGRGSYPMAKAKRKMQIAHHEPQGEFLEEKKRLKSPKNVVDKIPGYYDGKPAPLGFPIEEPPKMKNGYHPDLVDGKKVANRYNRLDPISAKAMPPTGNPHIDRKVRAAAKKSK